MKILVFNDPLLMHRDSAIQVQAYLSGFIAGNREAIDLIAWGPREDDHTKLALSIRCQHKYARCLMDSIHEILIQARLNLVTNSLLESLAWKFSSPALTTAFRDIIVPVSPGTTPLSPDEDLK
jgi:hypothetical protein